MIQVKGSSYIFYKPISTIWNRLSSETQKTLIKKAGQNFRKFLVLSPSLRQVQIYLYHSWHGGSRTTTQQQMHRCLRLLDSVTSDLCEERPKRKRRVSVIPSRGECSQRLSIQMFQRLCCVGHQHPCCTAPVQMMAEFGTYGRALHMQLIDHRPRRHAGHMQMLLG